MRTTIDIDAIVLAQLKERQQEEGKTLGQLVSELLAVALSSPKADRADIAWYSADLGEPLVDLEDKDAVHAALDRGE
ncbi:antitoxin [Aldersonia kunmingensis]|uniref:antitoxin n=1 Tax=Aldersonia kunmingensis TaxID=408066 RepID=UPI000835F424|nr:antitoxin [Aldersonia kunmingensis]